MNDVSATTRKIFEPTVPSEFCRMVGMGLASSPAMIFARSGEASTYPAKAIIAAPPPTTTVRIIDRGMARAGSGVSSAISPQASNPYIK
jgi:hypothetical protein